MCAHRRANPDSSFVLVVGLLGHTCLLLQININDHCFSIMDALVQATRKGAAKCNNHCDLQISENQLNLECGLHFWILPESLPASVLLCSTWILVHVVDATTCCCCFCMKLAMVLHAFGNIGQMPLPCIACVNAMAMYVLWYTTHTWC